MSQSSTIAFFLLAGFVIFVTMKGELPAYAAVVGFGPTSGASASTVAAAQNMGVTNSEEQAYESSITP